MIYVDNYASANATYPPPGSSLPPVTLTWRVDVRFEILKAGATLPDVTPSLVEEVTAP